MSKPTPTLDSGPGAARGGGAGSRRQKGDARGARGFPSANLGLFPVSFLWGLSAVSMRDSLSDVEHSGGYGTEEKGQKRKLRKVLV